MTDRPNVSYGDGDYARANEILRTTVGSGVHGLAIAGTDDHDEMGVFIESKAHVYGMGPSFDQFVWRTQPEGARSGPGDTDLIIYSLRKYLRMAAKGNPTALLPLFAPDSDVIVVTGLGADLRSMADAFLSVEAVHRFLGYMHQQHERMMGRSNRNVPNRPNRPELIEKYGWDVKYGSHALRLAHQGLEIASEGTLTLPMPQKLREHILAVKRGQLSREWVSGEIRYLEAQIQNLLRNKLVPLPAEPRWSVIERFSIDAHDAHWNGTADVGRRPPRQSR